MTKPKRPRQISRTTIYESEWINLHSDKVEYPDGRIVDELRVLDYPKEGVGVVVVNDQTQILLEYAYRYHTGQDGWEVPAGAIDPGEDVITAGQREVEEETGYQTKNHQLVYSYNPSNGSSNQVLHVVFCELTSNKQKAFDKNEVREVRWFTKQAIEKMIVDKEMVDGHSLLALLLYFTKLI